MTRLFLVRHGQTTSNEIHALDTALPGASLTMLGREQAGAAGRYLRNASDRVHVLSSKAARAQQTAAGLAAAFAAEGGSIATAAPGSSFADGFQRFRGRELAGLVDTAAVELAGEHAGSLASIFGVAEIPAGDMEMKNDEDSHELYHRLLGDWLHGQIDKVVPGGSSGAEVLTSYLPQALAVVAAAQAEDADAVLVSHGAVIRLVATWLGAVDPEFAYRAYLPNGQVVSIALPEDFGELLDQVAEAVDEQFRNGVRGRFRVTEWGPFGVPELASTQQNRLQPSYPGAKPASPSRARGGGGRRYRSGGRARG